MSSKKLHGKTPTQLCNRINRIVRDVPGVWAEVHGRAVRLYITKPDGSLSYYRAHTMRPAELSMTIATLNDGN